MSTKMSTEGYSSRAFQHLQRKLEDPYTKEQNKPLLRTRNSRIASMRVTKHSSTFQSDVHKGEIFVNDEVETNTIDWSSQNAKEQTNSNAKSLEQLLKEVVPANLIKERKKLISRRETVGT